MLDGPPTIYGASMKYRETKQDKDLRSWFQHDLSHAHLRRIVLKDGNLRGLSSLDISFEFPISAIAGKNGAGKSTILAMACCAFHNGKASFRLPKRKLSYYTFSDFFIQHPTEQPSEGIEINYYIAYNNWAKTASQPNQAGVRMQRRRKNRGGKWNDYVKRVKRNVAFLGIERIVPHNERSQSRSYSRLFKDAAERGHEENIRDAVSYVLAKPYTNVRLLEHSKYMLPIVEANGFTYSGFNMGAGENALFEIFSVIYSCGKGSLLVLDEIELGLHAEAQRRLIRKLKDVCLETRTQIICTTHSKEIFDCLPYDARFFLEAVRGKTKITQGISSEFAFSKLSAQPRSEVDVLVEDEIAKSILTAALPSELRTRISIVSIGSATALARQLSAIYLKGEERPTIAIFDGDQRSKETDNLKHGRSMAENPGDDFDSWFAQRIAYLPGDIWPEAWLVQQAQNCVLQIAAYLNFSDADELNDILEYGLQAGKHNEFYEISARTGVSRDICINMFSSYICQGNSSIFDDLATRIQDALEMAG